MGFITRCVVTRKISFVRSATHLVLMGVEEDQLTPSIRVSATAWCCTRCGPPLVSLNRSHEYDVETHLQKTRRAFKPQLAFVWPAWEARRSWAPLGACGHVFSHRWCAAGWAHPPGFLPGEVKAPSDKECGVYLFPKVSRYTRAMLQLCRTPVPPGQVEIALLDMNTSLTFWSLHRSAETTE